MAQEKVFADGFIFKRREDAPDFVIGNISIKVDEAIAFLREHEKNGWVNLQAKTGRTGNHYIELDTFQPKAGAKKSEPKAEPKASQPEVNENLPF